MTDQHTHHDHHDHSCGTRHNHEHDHDAPQMGISVEEHDSVMVATVRFSTTGDFEMIEKDIAQCLEEVSSMVVSNEGVIGHIKASVKGEGRISTLSTTGGEVSITQGQSDVVGVDAVVIVLNVEQGPLMNIVHKVFARYI